MARFRRMLAAAILAACIAVPAAAVPANAAWLGTENMGDGWYNVWDSSGWHWNYFENGSPIYYGFKQIAGKWYYFERCCPVTGYRRIGNDWYYFHPAYGYMMTGWQYLYGAKYYFWPDTGKAAHGPAVKIGGATYVFYYGRCAGRIR